jgi:dTDP-glucose 4,6-dehydratase
MRVLVTGGCGFIGSHFVKRLLAAGEQVIVLDKLTYAGNRANLDGVDCDVVEGDIADPRAVAAAAEGCDAIVNFAAETHVDRSILGAGDFVLTDVLGVYVLLEHAREQGLRLVHVSTDEVYGDVAPGVSSRETDALRPSSPYAASKAGGDLQVLAYVRTHGADALVTRGSNTYGPNQYPEKLVPLFVTNALDGEPLPLYGDGRQTRDWLHVRDHCAAIELLLHRGEPGGIYNVGAGSELENVDVARRIVELTGADPALVRHVEDRPGHDRRYSLDSSRLHALGWRPQRGFEEGLAETVEWYRSNRAWWEPLKSGEYRDYYLRQYGSRLSKGEARAAAAPKAPGREGSPSPEGSVQGRPGL